MTLRGYTLFAGVIAALMTVSVAQAQSTPTVGKARADALDQFMESMRRLVRSPAATGTSADRATDSAWLTVESEWAAAAPSPANASQTGLAATGALASGNSASLSTSAASRSRTSRSASSPGRGGPSGGGPTGGVRIGSTSVNASADNIATTANGGTAATNIGTRGGGTGSARIDASAKNVVTISNAGNAETNIGARDSGGGNTSVSAKNTITESTGVRSQTNIGTEGGVVSTGLTYNQGGTLSINASGTKRNGLTCIEIFRQTCIIHIYIRPKKKPCFPGYFTEFRRCLLPSDLRHKIVK